MSDVYWPKLALDQKELDIAKRRLAQGSLNLDDPACPYSEDVKALLRGPQVVEKIVYRDREMEDDFTDGVIELATEEDLLKEVAILSRELKEYGKGLNRGGGEDGETKGSDMNTYFRLSVTLMERILQIREKASLLVEHSRFVNEVLNILADILNADQREAAIERLKRFNVTLPA